MVATGWELWYNDRNMDKVQMVWLHFHCRERPRNDVASHIFEMMCDANFAIFWPCNFLEGSAFAVVSPLFLPGEDVRKLLIAVSGDAALLYLLLKSGASLEAAPQELRMSTERLNAAVEVLVREQLLPAPRRSPAPDSRPAYTERELTRELQKSGEFTLLVGEAQRMFGRVLSTEELKTLLAIYDYLRLPYEVIGLLIEFCIQRGRARGSTRTPSLRTIEKEAYRWSDSGVETMEQACSYMTARLAQQSQIGRMKAMLQVYDRRLTDGEERYIQGWLEDGFDEDAIYFAYEKTCMNTGGLKWPYMNSILKSWHEKKLHTVAEIQKGDGGAKPARGAKKKGELSELERDAVKKLLNSQEA